MANTSQPLSEESLAVLDSLEHSCPELWRYIRECGQALLLVIEEKRELLDQYNELKGAKGLQWP